MFAVPPPNDRLWDCVGAGRKSSPTKSLLIEPVLSDGSGPARVPAPKLVVTNWRYSSAVSTSNVSLACEIENEPS